MVCDIKSLLAFEMAFYDIHGSGGFPLVVSKTFLYNKRMKIRSYPTIVLSGFVAVGILLWALVRFSPEGIFYASIFPEVILVVFVAAGACLFFLLRDLIGTRVKILQHSQKVRKKNERYNLISEGLNDGVWDWDMVSGKVFFSDSWRQMLSYPKNKNKYRVSMQRGDTEGEEQDGDQFLSKEDLEWWSGRVHPDDLPAVQQRMDIHFSGKKPYYEAQYRIKSGRGRYIWILDRGRAEQDADGNFVRMAGITSNIQNLKNVEATLKSRTNEVEVANQSIRNEKARTDAFLESIGEGVIAVDTNGIVTLANPASQELLELEEKQMLGVSFSDVIPKQEDKSEKEVFNQNRLINRTLASGDNLSDSFYYYRRSGEKFPVSVTVGPIYFGETLSGAIVVFRDITREMEIDKQKTEFVSLASHQLRTPLSAIRWYSEMVLTEKLGPLTDKQKQYVKEIYDSNVRMIDLVNALLNVSRIEMGTFAVEPKEIDLWQILEDVIEELMPYIKKKELVFSKDYENAPRSFFADENLVRIVFQNLLSNSVKYTPENGRVSICVTENGDSLRIEVADTGYGIPKKAQPNMFTKLFRADNIKTQDTEGTGLGLYVIKSVVEKSGGKIWFESIENEGTTFYVELPMSGMKRIEGTKGLEATG